MNANCEFVVQEAANVVTVPSEAVRTDDSGSYVETAVGGQKVSADEAQATGAVTGPRITHRTVTVGLQGNDATEIKSGLAPGDPVIVLVVQPNAETTSGSSPISGKGAMGPGGPPPGGGK
jgi:HlyD family secretion protein